MRFSSVKMANSVTYDRYCSHYKDGLVTADSKGLPSSMDKTLRILEGTVALEKENFVPELCISSRLILCVNRIAE